jgi:iron complex outermembrane receptor protein
MTKVRAHVALTVASAMSALALGQSSAFAQTVPAADPAAAASTDALQEVVVTAEFRKERLQETPIAITAVNAEAMEQRNMTNLIDVANVAPNVTMFENSAAYGKTNAAFIRGIGQGDFNLAAGEPGVGIYIDDVYFATTLGSAFDLYDLESVEILRGPQGTLEGKNSIGGAIEMHSKKPTGSDSGYVDVTAGDFSRRDLKAAYDMKITDDVFMRVSAFEQYRAGYVTRANYACATGQPAAGSGATTDSRGYTINTNAPNYLQGNTPNQLGGSCAIGTEGGIDVRGARAQIRWLINDKMENNFTGYVVDDNSEAAAETLVATQSSPTTAPLIAGFNTYLLAKYGQEFDNRFLSKNFYTTYSSFYDPDLQESIPNTNSMHQWGFSDVFDWDVAEKMHLKSVTAFLGYWTDFSDDQSNTPLPLAWAYNLVDHQQFTQEFRLTGKAFDDQLDWATGAFYYRGTSLNRGQVNIALFGGAAGPTAGFNFQQNSPSLDQNEAVFAQATEHLTDKLDLTAGVRGTHEDKSYTYQSFFFPEPRLGPYGVDYSHVDWKVNAGYKITSDVLAYASISTGFRGGGFNPRPFAQSQINEFQPEKLTEYEIGLKSDWFDHHLRANVAAYYGNYSNLQFNSQRLDSNGVPYTGITNVGGANISGYEVEISARPVGALTIDASLGYTAFFYKNLGNHVGCGSGPNAATLLAAGECIAGNPTYSDYPVGQPKLKGNVGVAYAFNIPGGSSVTPRVDLTYQSRIYDDVTNNIPDAAIIGGRTLLDGRVQWDAANGKWSVAFLGTNLTNKEYYVSLFDLRAFGEGMETGQPGAPREWAVNVHYKF